MDSVGILSSANLHVDQLRRDRFKPVLPTGYKSLATSPDAPSEFLFGNLDKRMKDVEEKLKLENQLNTLTPPVRINTQNTRAFNPPRTNPVGSSRPSRGRAPKLFVPSKNGQSFPKTQDVRQEHSTSGRPRYTRKWNKKQ